ISRRSTTFGSTAAALFAIGASAQRAMAHPYPAPRSTSVTRTAASCRWTGDWSALAITRSFSRRLMRYGFCAPWIALNQENHARYHVQGHAVHRDELDRILLDKPLGAPPSLRRSLFAVGFVSIPVPVNKPLGVLRHHPDRG